LGAGALATRSSWRSSAYGARCEAPELAYTATGGGRQTAVTVLAPGGAQARLRERGAARQVVELTGPSYRDTVARRGDAGTLEIAGVTSDADCAVLVGGAQGEATALYLLGASFVEGEAGRRAVGDSALHVMRREGQRWMAQPTLDRAPE
jgi:hypothetical protein